MRIVIGAVLAAVLAGCGPGESTENTAAPAANGTDYVAVIRDMNPEVRKATLLRAIRDARQPCQQVIAERAAGGEKGQGVWTARCEDGTGWMITIAPDGNAKVTGPVARKK